MRAHMFSTVFALVAGFGLWPSAPGVLAQEYEEYPLETRIWMDRGSEPILQQGEAVRLYYRVSQDAFVAIFHIDTNGTARMVFPTSPQENHYARGGRDYRLLFPGSTYWYVNEDPGMGYFFLVASPQPFDFSDLRYSHYDGGWDLSFVGRQVYGDPYLAMDDYVAALIPDWEYVAYGLDFTAYNVEQRYDYPRFMCYDCHGFRPFNVWNPYHYSCANFRVVIYNDPYYYPVTRYRGTRVVYVQPRRGLAHFGFKERAVGEAGTPQIVVRNSRPVSQPGVAGTETRRAQPRSSMTTSGAAGQSSGVSSRRAAPSTGSGTSSGVQRRPSSGSATRLTPPSSRGNATERRGTPQTVPLTTPRTGGTRPSGQVRRITEPPRSTVASPPGTTGNRPVLERRPGTATPPRSARPTPKPAQARPSTKVRKGGGGTGGTSATGTSRVIKPGGGSGGSGGRTILPSVRSRGSSGTTSRPTVQRNGGTTRTPVVRNGGRTTRPTVRSNGGTTPRPAVRSSGGGTTRPTVRSSGGTIGRSGATVRRPPVQKKTALSAS